MYAADPKVLAMAKAMVVRSGGGGGGLGGCRKRRASEARGATVPIGEPHQSPTTCARPQASGTANELKPIERVWAFMPFMHSEELADQQVGTGARLAGWARGGLATVPERELLAPPPRSPPQECVRLFKVLLEEAEAAGHDALAGMLRMNVKYAMSHEQVVQRWGRFPHRNAILGREPTPDEVAGMADGSIPKF